MTSTEVETLEYFVQGKKDSKTAVVFFQGWPDNNTVWDPLDWQNTMKDNKLIFINFPNTSPTQEVLKWGQDFPVIVQRMKVTVDAATAGCTKKVMVAHDWGCTYGYIFDKTFPTYFNELITLDVPGIVEVNGFLPKIFVLVYQFILATSFLVGGFPGRLLTQGVAKFFRYNPKHFSEINATRNYPYFYFIKNILSSIFNKPKAFLYHYRPSVPVVYIYGSKKPFLFHGNKWENYIKESDKCEMHKFECGHWIMNRYGKDVTDIILRRIKSL